MYLVLISENVKCYVTFADASESILFVESFLIRCERTINVKPSLQVINNILGIVSI